MSGKDSIRETNKQVTHNRAPGNRGPLLIGKEKKMEEKKKVTKRKRRPGKDEALEHIERIRIYGAPYYRKIDVLRLLRTFIELYWR